MPDDNGNRPDVLLTLEGLLILCDNKEEKQCEIGALSTDKAGKSGHKLTITITKVSLSGATTLYDTSFGHDFSRSLKLLEIDAESPVDASVRYRTYGAESTDAIDRKTITANPDDFRWVLDFQGEDFHGQNLKLEKPDFLKPILIVKNGEFYTEELSRERLERSVNGGPFELFGYGTTVVGAGITLNPGGKAILRLSDQDDSKVPGNSMTFNLPKEPDTFYEIKIENLCAQITTDQTGQAIESADFDLYYDVFDVPETEQFTLRAVKNRGGTDTLPDNPCMPGRLGSQDGLTK